MQRFIATLLPAGLAAFVFGLLYLTRPPKLPIDLITYFITSKDGFITRTIRRDEALIRAPKGHFIDIHIPGRFGGLNADDEMLRNTLVVTTYRQDSQGGWEIHTYRVNAWTNFSQQGLLGARFKVTPLKLEDDVDTL